MTLMMMSMHDGDVGPTEDDVDVVVLTTGTFNEVLKSNKYLLVSQDYRSIRPDKVEIKVL